MRDFYAGLGFIIAGIVTVITAQQFPTLPSLQYGPSLFPSLIGGGFCIGGAVLAFNALWHRKKAIAQGIQVTPETAKPEGRGINLALILPPLSIVFYILASGYIGALLSMIIIMLVLMLVRKTSPYIAVATSIVVSGIIYFIFSRYLLIPLPPGVLLGGSLPWIS